MTSAYTMPDDAERPPAGCGGRVASQRRGGTFEEEPCFDDADVRPVHWDAATNMLVEGSAPAVARSGKTLCVGADRCSCKGCPCFTDGLLCCECCRAKSKAKYRAARAAGKSGSGRYSKKSKRATAARSRDLAARLGRCTRCLKDMGQAEFKTCQACRDRMRELYIDKALSNRWAPVFEWREAEGCWFGQLVLANGEVSFVQLDPRLSREDVNGAAANACQLVRMAGKYERDA